jgi:glycosyltransferase involved in cell wall biosynthesis
MTVSLCMIVRNEETNLDACLASAADIVDDTVIVDTGSTDATKARRSSKGGTLSKDPVRTMSRKGRGSGYPAPR